MRRDEGTLRVRGLALMDRAEVLSWLRALKWHLVDAGHVSTAQEVEDVELRVDLGASPASMREYGQRFVLPRGRRGRVRLLLHSPVTARALALLCGVLRSFED